MHCTCSMPAYFGLIIMAFLMCTSSLAPKSLLRNSRQILLRMSSFSTTDPTSRLFKEDINMLYDSKCNLCMMEVNYLSKKDKAGKIKFTDIEDPSYDPSDPANANIEYATGMKSMHAVLANGEVITGVAVFRELYSAIGLGWLYGFTKYPVIKPIMDSLYDSWAVYRTDLTRGTPVDVLIQERNKALEDKMMTKPAGSTEGGDACLAMKDLK